MAQSRIVRKRPPKAEVFNEFEVTLKLRVAGPGVTAEKMQTYVANCIRYSSAAHIWQVFRDSTLSDYQVTETKGLS